jgi:hypothetical protein
MAYAWAPTLQQVAIWVPWLTVSTVTPGDQEPSGTFGSDTEPNDIHAQEHVDRAALVVGAGLGTVPTAPATVYELAGAVAALRAAIALARAYPRDRGDLDYADALQSQYDSDLAALTTAVDTAGGDTPSTAGPVMHAPDPVPWGDVYL